MLMVVKWFELEGERERQGLGRCSMVGNKVAKRIGDTNEEICSFATELERVQVLKRYCGITIDEDEVKYIQGQPPALPLA